MKTALILGITSASGTALAEQAALDRYTLIGTYHINKPVRQDIRLIQLDIEDRASIDAMVCSLNGIKFDLIINTLSSPAIPQRLGDIPYLSFSKSLSSNVLHPFYVMQQLFPQCNPGCNIVFLLTEYVTEQPPAYLLPYVSTKHALLGVMKAMSVELAPRSIRVNAISPGMMETNFTKHLPAYVKESYIAKSALGRLTTPKDLAWALHHILSNTMTGQNIPLFGEEFRDDDRH